METVRIRFTPYQSRWIRERQYHSSQTLEELPDGGVLMTPKEVMALKPQPEYVMYE